MRVLDALEPNRVFYYFEEICNIPHGSGNVDMISDYLVDFAVSHGLVYIQDELKNVIIVKEASEGYENEPGMILQGHMDMVAVAKPGLKIDMTKDPLRLRTDGDFLYAEGTSLGGDDGIAVAYALAILESDNIKHPRLEVIITVDEEVGMDGAAGIDLSSVRGNRLLNLDSEDEGIFLAGCAGGARANCSLELSCEERDAVLMRLTVGGLKGGHSGEMIHLGRGNSNCIAGRVIYELCEEMPVGIVGVQGGLADNAIARETVAALAVDAADTERLVQIVSDIEQNIANELTGKDDDFFIKVEEIGEKKLAAVTYEDTKRAAAVLIALPGGVQAMSAAPAGLVETSLNMGILTVENGVMSACFSVRSSIESSKWALIDKMRAILALAGGSVEVAGVYPGWQYRNDSPLRDKMIGVYKKMYGEEPKVCTIHAGLECGLLGDKIENLDCVSIGPQMKNIHTTEEKLSISSTKRVWEYILALLAKKD